MIQIIKELDRNKIVFEALLFNTPKEAYHWKPQPQKWGLLEIICHLRDEEIEDFRARIKHLFNTPDLPLKPFDPEKWVTERKYIDQIFEEVLRQFLKQRTASIVWLQSLKDPKWDNYYNHPILGKLSAKMYLANWLAHDYLHLRQITRLKFQYLEKFSGEDLSYAGGW